MGANIWELIMHQIKKLFNYHMIHILIEVNKSMAQASAMKYQSQH